MLSRKQKQRMDNFDKLNMERYQSYVLLLRIATKRMHNRYMEGSYCLNIRNCLAKANKQAFNKMVKNTLTFTYHTPSATDFNRLTKDMIRIANYCDYTKRSKWCTSDTVIYFHPKTSESIQFKSFF